MDGTNRLTARLQSYDVASQAQLVDERKVNDSGERRLQRAMSSDRDCHGRLAETANEFQELWLSDDIMADDDDPVSVVMKKVRKTSKIETKA